MRNIILTGLLAATIAPGIAQAQDRDPRDDRRDLRQEERHDRRDVREARQEYRGDWRDYRRTNPDIYRGPRWVGPRGYAYRPVGVGYRFRPEFYDRRYWVDPYRYHLRPVAGWQRWIRYGQDVLLIDTRSGAVIEVNRGFFF